MAKKEKAEAPEEEPIEQPEVRTMAEVVGDLERQVATLRDQMRTHYRAHHKFESSVWESL